MHSRAGRAIMTSMHDQGMSENTIDTDRLVMHPMA